MPKLLLVWAKWLRFETLLPKGFRAEFDLLHKAEQPFRRETQWLPDTLDDLIHLCTIVFRDLLFLLLWTTASESFLVWHSETQICQVRSMFFWTKRFFFFFFLGFWTNSLAVPPLLLLRRTRRQSCWTLETKETRYFYTLGAFDKYNKHFLFLKKN